MKTRFNVPALFVFVGDDGSQRLWSKRSSRN